MRSGARERGAGALSIRAFEGRRWRIAELDAQIQAYSGDIDQIERVWLAAERLRELAVTVRPNLADPDWHRRREVIRTLVQRVELGHENIKIVFRVLQDAGRSAPESIAVMLPR